LESPAARAVLVVLANRGALEESENRVARVELGDPAVQVAVADRAPDLQLVRLVVAGPIALVIVACRPVDIPVRAAVVSAAGAEITRAPAAVVVATAWVEEDIAAAVAAAGDFAAAVVAGAVAAAEGVAVVAAADK
jgi:hypothetical protein